MTDYSNLSDDQLLQAAKSYGLTADTAPAPATSSTPAPADDYSKYSDDDLLNAAKKYNLVGNSDQGETMGTINTIAKTFGDLRGNMERYPAIIGSAVMNAAKDSMGLNDANESLSDQFQNPVSKAEDNPLYKIGEATIKRSDSDFPVSDKNQDSYIPKIARALTSAVPIIASGPLAPFTAAAEFAPDYYDEARKFGAGDVDAQANAVLGSVLSAVLQSIIPGQVSSMVNDSGLPTIIKAEMWDTLKNAGTSMVKFATEGGAIGAAQQVINNLIAKDVLKYDPERDELQGVGSAAGVGATSSALLGGIGNVLKFAVTGGRGGAGGPIPQEPQTPQGPDFANMKDVTPDIDPDIAAAREAIAPRKLLTNQNPEPENTAPAEQAQTPQPLSPEEEESQYNEALRKMGFNDDVINSIQKRNAEQNAEPNSAPSGDNGESNAENNPQPNESTSNPNQIIPQEGSGNQQPSAAELPAEVRQTVAMRPNEGTSANPIEAKSPSDVDAAAAQANPDPTPAQKEAGNYQKGHLKIQGLDVTIETPEGGARSGTDSSGEAWSVKMPASYGYVKGTEGADGEHVDTYVGRNPNSDKVFVIDQHNPQDGKFDEHKAFLGFDSEAQVREAYGKAFSDGSGPARIANDKVFELSPGQFKGWLNSETAPKNPFDYEPESKNLPEDNYGKQLSAHSPVIFTQKSISQGLELIPYSGISTEIPEVYMADHPSMALGQGGNARGITIAFDTKNIRGQINKKPAWELGYQSGAGSEYRSTLNKQSDYQKSVVAIRVPDGLQGSKTDKKLLDNTLSRLENNGWKKTTSSNHTDYVNPNYKPDNAKTKPAAESLAKFAPDAAGNNISTMPVKSDIATTPNGIRLPVKYAVADADDLTTSHDDDMRPNPAYPQELQPRDRSRNASEAQIQDMLNPQKFDPRRLGESPLTSEGAPVVSSKGIVESGNGRTIALKRAYDQNLPAAGMYRNYLQEKGYDTTGVKNPMLVRMRDQAMTPQERQAYIHDSNERSTAGMSDTERAIADSKLMGEGTLSLYRGGDINTIQNLNFVRSFLKDAVSANDRNSIFTNDGQLSQMANRRIRNALLAKAYEDPVIVNSIAESADDHLASMGKSLTDVAASWAQMRQEAADGIINREVDNTKNLVDAVKMILHARQNGKPITDFIGQKDIFSGDQDLNTTGMIPWFYNNESLSRMQSRQDMTDTLRYYIDQARQTTGAVDILGSTGVTPQQLIEQIARKRQEEEDRKNAQRKNQGNLLLQGKGGNNSANNPAQHALQQGEQAPNQQSNGAGQALPPSSGKELSQGGAEAGGQGSGIGGIQSGQRQGLNGPISGDATSGLGAGTGSGGAGSPGAESAAEPTGGGLSLDGSAGQQPVGRGIGAQPKVDFLKKYSVVRADGSGPGFYSALRAGIEGVKQPKAFPEQWKGILRNLPYIKKEELDWLGVHQWLDTQKGPVTREALQDFVKNNQAQVQEVMRGHTAEMANSKHLVDMARMLKDKAVNDYHGYFQQIDKESGNGNDPSLYPPQIQAKLAELQKSMESASATYAKAQKSYLDKSKNSQPKYEDLSLEGPYTNYRELMLTLGGEDKGFKGSHFSEPNILAHVRFNDRMLPGGKRALHIEEIQSDWHQGGRDNGYVDTKGVKSQEELLARRMQNLSDQQLQNLHTIDMGELPVPEGPFKKTWHELAMKRMLREATERGYDKMTWTMGKDNADRYNLGKKLSRVTYGPEENGTLTAYGLDGEEVLKKQDISPEQISRYIGKNAAERIMAVKSTAELNPEYGYIDSDEGARKEISGNDLSVGDRGMRAFYDEKLPNFLNKYGKQWGVKVGTTALESGQTVHSIDITPEMSKSVMTGQPLFARDFKPQFYDDIPALKKFISAEAERMNPSAVVKMESELFGEGYGLIRSGASSMERQPVAGAYTAAKQLIEVSLDTSKFDPINTIYHELYHSLVAGLSPKQKAFLEEAIPEFGNISAEERGAMEFADAMQKNNAKQPIALKKIFTRMMILLRNTGNYLRGKGFQSVQGIFQKMYNGEIGKKTRSVENFTQHSIPYATQYSIGKKLTPEQEDLLKRADRIIADTRPDSVIDSIKDFMVDAKKDGWLRFRKSMIDSLAAIHDYETRGNNGVLLDASRSPYKALEMSRNVDGVMSIIMGVRNPGNSYEGGAIEYYEKKDAQGNVTESGFAPSKVINDYFGDKRAKYAHLPPYFEILRPISEQGPVVKKLFDSYSVARRGKILIAEGRENLMTPEDISKFLAQEKEHPEFKTAFEQRLELNTSVVDVLQAVGGLSPETRAMWLNSDYVPFDRVFDEEMKTGPYTSKDFEGQSYNKGKLKGGTSKIAGVDRNYVMNWRKMFDVAYKTMAMNRLDSMMADSGIWREKKYVKPVPSNIEEMNAMLQKRGVNPKSVTPTEKATLADIFRSIPPQGSNIISFLQNGRFVYREVDDPLMLNAVRSLDPIQLGKIGKLMSWQNKLYRGFVVNTPVFALRILFKDIASAMVIGGDPMIAPRSVSGLVKALKKDKLTFTMLGSGAGVMPPYTPTPEVIQKRLGRMSKTGLKAKLLNTPAMLMDAWHDFNISCENASRYGIMDTTLKNGGTLAEAAWKGMDLRDYSRRGDGEVAKLLMATVPFWNAGVQAKAKLGRVLTSKETYKKVIMTGSILAMINIGLWGLNHDNPAYQELHMWEKNSGIYIPISREKGTFFKLPKPFQVGFLFMTIPENIANLAYGNETSKEFRQSMKEGFLDALTVNPLSVGVHVVQPIIDNEADKDSFTDIPIETEKMKKESPPERYDYHTSLTARYIGEGAEKIGAPEWMQSPVRFEHMMKGFTADISTYLMAASDVAIRQFTDEPTRPVMRLDEAPFFKNFVHLSPANGTLFLDHFYDMKNHLDQIYKASKAIEENKGIDASRKFLEDSNYDWDVHKKLKKAAKNMAKWRRQMNVIRDNSASNQMVPGALVEGDPESQDHIMTADEKRIELDKRKTAINTLARSVDEEIDKMTLPNPSNKSDSKLGPISDNIGKGDVNAVQISLADAAQRGEPLTKGDIENSIRAANQPELLRLMQQSTEAKGKMASIYAKFANSTT